MKNLAATATDRSPGGRARERERKEVGEIASGPGRKKIAGFAMQVTAALNFRLSAKRSRDRSVKGEGNRGEGMDYLIIIL